MKNSELWASYKEYTETLSSNARTLGFAAAGICWIFKGADNTFPKAILLALVFDVSYFLCDMIQFLLAAVFLRIWTRREEVRRWKHESTIDGDYLKPPWLDYPAYTLWWMKVFCLLISFILIGWHILLQ